MNALRFQHSSKFEASGEALWSFHMRQDAIDLLSPKVFGFKVVDRGEGVVDGSVVEFRVGRWPFRRRWVALHGAIQEGESFTDVALEGPFRFWAHQHTIESPGPGVSLLTDTVWFLPPSFCPAWVCRLALKGLFSWRHLVTRRSIERTTRQEKKKRHIECVSTIGGSS